MADRHAPTLIAHQIRSPPFGGGMHKALPLPGRDLLVVVVETGLDRGEDGIKPIWIMNNQVRGNPIPISTRPPPRDRDDHAVGGHFGRYNIHENHTGRFVSEALIFATDQNAGVRIYDIRAPSRPAAVGACVPAAPAPMVGPRPNRAAVRQSAEVFGDAQGLVDRTKFTAGLPIIAFPG